MKRYHIINDIFFSYGSKLGLYFQIENNIIYIFPCEEKIIIEIDGVEKEIVFPLKIIGMHLYDFFLNYMTLKPPYICYLDYYIIRYKKIFWEHEGEQIFFLSLDYFSFAKLINFYFSLPIKP